MKNINKLFAIAIVILGFSATSFAQVTATATSSATIITPISINKTFDMNFGNVAVSGTGGTVVLSPASARSITGGVTLPTVAGTIKAATFTVAGLAGSTYSITLPSTDHSIFNGDNVEMIVNAFTCSPTPTGLIAVGGNQTLTVGATLNVNANQAAGTYISTTPFDVTVNYN